MCYVLRSIPEIVVQEACGDHRAAEHPQRCCPDRLMPFCLAKMAPTGISANLPKALSKRCTQIMLIYSHFLHHSPRSLPFFHDCHSGVRILFGAALL